jgi:hypothetical protein
MITTRKPDSIIPDLPRSNQVVDENGTLTIPWQLFFDQLIFALQTNLKPEGFVMPPVTAANIAMLGNTSASIGNILYDSTNNLFKGIELVTLGPPVVTITKTFTLT